MEIHCTLYGPKSTTFACFHVIQKLHGVCFTGAPKITFDADMDEKVVRKSGQNVELSATVTGHPKPIMSWYFADKELFSVGGLTIKSHDTTAILKMSSAAGENSGKYRLVATNKVGQDEVEFDLLVRDRPSPPLNLGVKDVDKQRMTLTWDEPSTDGGAEIERYIVEKKDLSKAQYVSAGTVDAEKRELTIDRLIEGNEYLFRVCAENSIGASDWTTTAEPIKARLPFDPPGAPRNVEASDVTVESCVITWSPPEFDGGKPISGYYVEKMSGSRWIKVNRKPVDKLRLVIDDLIEGSDCEYRVVAENEAGLGKPSESTGVFKAKNPYELPGRPEAPVVDDITADSARVSWQPPASDGGATITSYVIEMKQRSEAGWKVTIY